MAKIETSTTGAGGAPPAASSGVHERQFGMWSSALVGPALLDSLRKLSPAAQMKNPVMFVVYAGSILTTILWIMALRGQAEAPAGFILAITVWLWFTVLFANFAEALAEGRGKQRPPCAACAPPSTRACSRDSRMPTPTAPRPTHGAARPSASPPGCCAAATWCWSRPAKPSPAMAR